MAMDSLFVSDLELLVRSAVPSGVKVESVIYYGNFERIDLFVLNRWMAAVIMRFDSLAIHLSKAIPRPSHSDEVAKAFWEQVFDFDDLGWIDILKEVAWDG